MVGHPCRHLHEPGAVAATSRGAGESLAAPLMRPQPKQNARVAKLCFCGHSVAAHNQSPDRTALALLPLLLLDLLLEVAPATADELLLRIIAAAVALALVRMK